MEVTLLMVRNEKLVQFYFNQYELSAKNKKKNHAAQKNYEKRINTLMNDMSRITKAVLKQERLEDYHRQLKNIAYYAFRESNAVAVMQLRDYLIPELIRLESMGLKSDEMELITEKFLQYLREKLPLAICTRTLKSLIRQYSKTGMEREIISMVPENPEMEFSQTRAMKRHFVLHIGPTNCGKTFHSLERLKMAENGIYLGPLRLLALEVYEQMKDSGIACTMLTGEECIEEPDSSVTSATIEMLEIDSEYDIAVIDEAQMIADRDRGHSWTRAILGICAKEIHICMSPAAQEVVTHLIRLCGDSMEINHYERKTALICEAEAFRFPEDIKEGDALIVFTKRAVLDIAGRLEYEGIHSSVIYGSLPPEIRRRQIHLFSEGETKVVVSTDAIGMGLNLPVRRIVFIQTDKFDGKERRPLNIPEIRQIAGRAGRFGLYENGYVNAMGEHGLRFIREHLEMEETPIEHVSLGFPRVLLEMAEPLNVILKIWKSVNPSPPFEKISIDEILFLYDRAYQVRGEIDGFDNKYMLFRMLTCSIDIKNKDIVDLWLYYCKTYTADVMLKFPTPQLCRDKGLIRYETYYKMLDLYHQFSVRMGKIMDQARLKKEREQTEDTIMRFLSKDKAEYIRKCKYCGKTLPVGYGYRICELCYKNSWGITNKFSL
jgi:ATP-dependent RNA helicase SUPV3L1/SUV3